MKTSKKITIPCLFIGMFTIGAYIAGIQLMGLRIVRDLGLDDALLSSVVAIHFVSLTVSGLCFGRLGDKIGKKKVIVIGFISLIIGCALISMATEIIGLIAGIFVASCGFGAVQVVGIAVLADVFPVKAPRYINISQMFFGLGSVASPLVCQAMLDLGLTWRQLIIGMGILGIFGVILTIFSNMQKVSLSSAEDSAPLSIKSIIKNKIFILLSLSMLVYVGIESSCTFFADLYFKEAVHMPELSAIALSGFWLAIAVSRLIVGIFEFNRYTMFYVGFGVSIIFVLLLTFIPSGIFSVINYIIIGLTYGSMFPNLMSISQDAFPANTGTASSLLFVSTGIGGGVIPILLGSLLSLVEINTAMLITVFFSVVGLTVAIILKNKVKKEDNPLLRR